MQEAGFEEVEAYVLRIKNMIAQYIYIQPILDLCKKRLVFRRRGSQKGSGIRRDCT